MLKMISFICPSFNRAPFLRDFSAPLMQLPAGLSETVIVDDGSTDDTLEVCSQLIGKYGDSRIRYFKNENNQGAQKARNLGILMARGEFIVFVDSDDVPVPKGIRMLYQSLQEHPEIDYVYGNVLKTNADLKPLDGQAVVGSPHDGSNRELAGYHWHTMGAMYRRDLIQKVGPWNPSLTGSQDWEYQARVKLAGRGLFIDELVGFWRQHEGGRVGTKKFRPDYVESVIRACEAILLAAEKEGRADAALRRRLGKKLLVHAVEWGANGMQNKKKECCLKAMKTSEKNYLISLVSKLLSRTPQWLDFRTHSLVKNFSQ
ncbi:MAG: glycosyltransferase family 2 protein [Verrucomicrobia bacterium]|nr:glycosyltransferase family 2 protein [Verrucomicrobiota bacterium]